MANFQLPHKSEVAFVSILFPFSAGIAASYEEQTYHTATALIPICCILFGYLLIVNNSNKTLKIGNHNSITGLCLHLTLFTIGCLCSISHKQSLNTDYFALKKSKSIRITINNEPYYYKNTIRFRAEVTRIYPDQTAVETTISQQASGNISVAIRTDSVNPSNLKSNPLPFRYGDELIIPSKFSEIQPPQNPSEFDFKAWLATQNIYHQTFIQQHEVINLQINTGNKLIGFALRLRAEQVALYRKLIKEDDAFAVASTLILGYRADLSTETLDVYAKTGTIHALSVSGMHVGLIYLILNWILSLLDKGNRLKALKVLLILVLIWFYALLTGLSASVLRSAIMISVFIVAKFLNKTSSSYNIIAFAAFCLLFYNPFLIWDVGFQLSFLAVLGLIWLQPQIEAWVMIKKRWIKSIWGTVAMSIAAQLITYPLSVYYFHQFPIYFLLSNLFIVLPVALIMYIGIALLVLKLDWLGQVLEWIITFTNNGLAWIAELPFSGVSAIWITKIELTLLSISLGLFIAALQSGKKVIFKASVLAFFCLQFSLTNHKIQAINQRKIIRFNLKKNYAIALILSEKAIVITDLTPELNSYKYGIKPALEQHKINQITFKETSSAVKKMN